MPLNIKELRSQKGFTQADLAERLGVSRQTIINWEKGITGPDHDEATRMSKIFDVDLSALPVAGKPVALIPFYDTIAVGGMSISADQSEVYNRAQAELIDPGTFLRRATGSLRVYGHSMFPKYPAGCIVAFKESDMEVIVWGEDYVIELEDRRIIKRIEKHKEIDVIKAVSYNKSVDYSYSEMEIPVRKIKRLYMVLGKIELEASL